MDPKPKSESSLWSSSGTSQKKGGPDSATLIKRTIPYIDTVGVSDELAEAGVGLLILALLLRFILILLFILVLRVAILFNDSSIAQIYSRIIDRLLRLGDVVVSARIDGFILCRNFAGRPILGRRTFSPELIFLKFL